MSSIQKYKLIINKKEFIFSTCICLFILSEYSPLFKWMDSLHIKHFALWLIVLYFGIKIIKVKNKPMLREVRTILISAGILYIISLYYQMKNNGFKLYSIGEVYYLVIPVITAIIIMYYSDKNNIMNIITIALMISVFNIIYVAIRNGVISISNIKSMLNIGGLILGSDGGLVETDLGVYCTVFFIYFFYKDCKVKATIRFLGCFMGGKRIAVIYAFVIIILNFSKKNIKNKKVEKTLFWLAVVIFCLLPFATYYMCSDAFANWFFHKFAISFDKFTMTRFSIINTVINADLTNYGLGTVTHFLEMRNVLGQTNMHNDILRIYMECGIIGIFTFAYSYFKIVRDNYYSFFIMLFIFIELYVAHFIGPGSMCFWIVSYLMIFEIKRECECKVEEKKNV